jgi:hypothetical protein
MRQILAVATAALALACVQTPSARAEVLITKAEADLPTPRLSQTRGLTRGPGIEQTSPSPTQRVASPFTFNVKFVARNNVDIDPSKVKLIYLKSTPIDLTPRIMRHVSAKGIAMTNAEVPPGVHVMRLEVTDMQGRAGTAIIKLDVAGN